MADKTLPPLPEPKGFLHLYANAAIQQTPGFTAAQMEAYARQAVEDRIDWRSLYRFERAMRFMDNNKNLTRNKAYEMADEDVASIEKMNAAPHHNQESGNE